MLHVRPAVIVMVLAGVSVGAQDAARVAFDVTSVKVNRSGSSDSYVNVPPGGTYSATNTPLARLLPNAFELLPAQIVGAPGWFGTDRFDILARPPADAQPEDLPAMLRALLADRFALKTHRERRDQPIFALTLVEAGKLGAKLSRAATDCEAVFAQKRVTPECQALMGIGRGGGTMTIKGQSLGRLTTALGFVLERPVVDQTGLTGQFDLDLKWSAGDASATSNDPEIFSAVREQLGLQLKPATGPVEVLVVDSAQHPTED
jgi:uncharacterized protein (TIGR03435 family)